MIYIMFIDTAVMTINAMMSIYTMMTMMTVNYSMMTIMITIHRILSISSSGRVHRAQIAVSSM